MAGWSPDPVEDASTELRWARMLGEVDLMPHEGEREARRLARLERDLGRALDLLHPASPLARYLDPWGDERAYLATAREAAKRVRARLG
ncbi:hypothetical protein [Limnochorda pilosa]|uniref:Uncharacterized protein n=1 Tax=Limnochorda pilosa TaxID=1555112 RepID=A0A0K2SQF3_LIMPI|nr:hypothetical protein [Limnochorda pilosa]BAS29355.1 hypothetical protein LIP_3544 [Limnochorda pilosa]